MEQGETIEQLRAMLAEKDRYIEALEANIVVMRAEQEEMVKQFKESTSLLIERLKGEEEQKTGLRPQTAQLLSRSRLNPSQTESSLMISQNESIGLEASHRTLDQDVKKGKCHNCGKMIAEVNLKKHVLSCYR